MPVKKTRNVLILTATSGPQPWPCHFCGEDVAFEFEAPGRGGHAKSPTLHHIDGDHDNDDPTNWAWAHTGCHNSYHSTGRSVGIKLSDEHREKIREGVRRYRQTKAGKAHGNQYS